MPSLTAEDRAVAVEAGIALGSARCGERTAGRGLNAGSAAFEQRGLDSVAVSPDERGPHDPAQQRAKRGDPEAAAALGAQHALERAVGDVVRAAPRLVPEQPATGRYRLPRRDPEVDAALAGLDPLAISVVFPEPPAVRLKPGKNSTVQVDEIIARHKAGETSRTIRATAFTPHVFAETLRTLIEDCERFSSTS